MPRSRRYLGCGSLAAGRHCTVLKRQPEIYLLKVKHRDCLVESRLESEPDWSQKPSIQNEYEFLSCIKEPWVPRVAFFTSARMQSQFLRSGSGLTPFREAVARMTAVELLDVWKTIEAAARWLYEHKIVQRTSMSIMSASVASARCSVDLKKLEGLIRTVPLSPRWT